MATPAGTILVVDDDSNLLEVIIGELPGRYRFKGRRCNRGGQRTAV
jgi:hypothetical protein